MATFEMAVVLLDPARRRLRDFAPRTGRFILRGTDVGNEIVNIDKISWTAPIACTVAYAACMGADGEAFLVPVGQVEVFPGHGAVFFPGAIVYSAVADMPSRDTLPAGRSTLPLF